MVMAAPLNQGTGTSLSARYSFSPRARASTGYVHVRDLSGSGASADQFSVVVQYDVSRPVFFYFSAAYPSNHDDARFRPRGVNVTGLPVPHPVAPVAGVQLGLNERF